MADVNAIINIDINSSSALLNLKRLESQIDQFNRSVSTSNATAAASQQGLNRALLDGINNTGLFTSKIVPVESSMTRFSRSLDEGRLSLGEYTRYAGSQLPGLSRVFRREFDSIEQVATSRVKSMQTQYIALGKTVDGVTRTIASTPTGLARGMATDLAMTQQRQQIFNKLLDDGSTKLLNWGKNTQWAGRQLMVGFSLPLAAFGAAASKTFMEIDKATISLKRVYGDLSTTKEELDSNVESVKNLGSEYTKYGITLAETISLSARAAATGATNESLMAATEQTLRFATLGQMDYNQALDTTISLQTAFAISNEDLGKTVDYLNAVENQTILTMEDMSLAIPRVATVVKGLGGSVEDLAVMMTAMREGGVSAENAANGLKSGLASLINPTKRASEGLAAMGVNLDSIITKNKGDLMGIITEFGTAINKLDEFSRQQVLEQVFGKFQYARMSALFTNITKDAGQAARAMDIAGMSAADLAKISEKELGQISESTSVKFQASMEKLKMSIAPIGEAFLKGITPIVDMVSKIADAFNNLPDGVKNAIAVLTGVVAGIGPVLLMTIGLLGNGIANITKFVQFIRKSLAGIKGDASAFTYLAQGELEATTASKALEGSAVSLTDKLLLQRGAVSGLTAEYERFARAAGLARAEMGSMGGAPVPSGGGRPPVPAPRLRRNTGGTIPGVGSTDTVPAMLTPGEFVINKKSTAQNLPLLHAINDGQAVGGFNKGGQIPGVQYFATQNKPRIVGPRPRSEAPKHIRKEVLARDLANDVGITEQQGRDILNEMISAGIIPAPTQSTYMQMTEIDTAHRFSNFKNGKKEWDLPNLFSAPGLENRGFEYLFGKRRKVGRSIFTKMFESQERSDSDKDLFDRIFGSNGAAPSTQQEADFMSRYMQEFNGYIVNSKDSSVKRFVRSRAYKNGWNKVLERAYKERSLAYSYRGGKEKPMLPRYPEMDEFGFKNKGGQILGGKVAKGKSFYGVVTPRSRQLFEALTAWQTSSREVRSNPEILETLMSAMSPLRSRRTLSRGTTLGLTRGSEFSPADEVAIMDALQSGNIDSIIGREFDMRGPISYTAGNTDVAVNAMRQNADVRRIEFLKDQQAEARKRHESNLKRVKTLKSKIAKGTGPVDTYKAQLKELEGFISMYPGGQAAMESEIKGLAARQYQELLIQQDFMPSSPVINVDRVNPDGTFMGRPLNEGEFLSAGSRVRIKGVGLDEATGIRKLELETIPSDITNVSVDTRQGNYPGTLGKSGQEIRAEIEQRKALISIMDPKTLLAEGLKSEVSGYELSRIVKTVIEKTTDPKERRSILRSIANSRGQEIGDGAWGGYNQELGYPTRSRDASTWREVWNTLKSEGTYIPWKKAVGPQVQSRNLGGSIFESQTKIVPGMGNTDTVPAMLTPGEFVINKQATRENLPLLHAINNGQVLNRNKGGSIQKFGVGGRTLPSAAPPMRSSDPAFFAEGQKYAGFEEVVLDNGLRVLRNLSGDGSSVTLQIGKYIPMHTGHAALLMQGIEAARTNGSDFVLAASGAYGRQSEHAFNPTFKRDFIQEATGLNPNMIRPTGFYKLFEDLKGSGYSHVTVSVGKDREKSYVDMAERAGIAMSARVMDRDGVSGTLLRQLAMDGKYEEFSRLIPASVSERRRREAYDSIREYSPFIKKGQSLRELATARTASRLHDEWRSSRLKSDGTYEPRLKDDGSGGQVDIANTKYSELPSRWQEENRISADEITKVIMRYPNLNEEQLSEIVHNQWIRRNRSWAPEDQLLPYKKLTEAEKEKDRVVTRLAKSSLDELGFNLGYNKGGQIPGVQYANRGVQIQKITTELDKNGKLKYSHRIGELERTLRGQSETGSIDDLTPEQLQQVRDFDNLPPQYPQTSRPAPTRSSTNQSTRGTVDRSRTYRNDPRRVANLNEDGVDWRGRNSDLVGPARPYSDMDIINKLMGFRVQDPDTYKRKFSEWIESTPMRRGDYQLAKEIENYYMPLLNKGGQIPSTQYFATPNPQRVVQSMEQLALFGPKRRVRKSQSEVNPAFSELSEFDIKSILKYRESPATTKGNEVIDYILRTQSGGSALITTTMIPKKHMIGIKPGTENEVYFDNLFDEVTGQGSLFRSQTRPTINLDTIATTEPGLVTEFIKMLVARNGGVPLVMNTKQLSADGFKWRQKAEKMGLIRFNPHIAPSVPQPNAWSRAQGAANDKESQDQTLGFPATLFRNTGGPIFESQSKIVPGVGSTDTVPAMLTPGEFVINKQSTRENLPLLHAINNGRVLNRNKGGQIPGMQYFGGNIAPGGMVSADWRSKLKLRQFPQTYDDFRTTPNILETIYAVLKNPFMSKIAKESAGRRRGITRSIFDYVHNPGQLDERKISDSLRWFAQQSPDLPLGIPPESMTYRGNLYRGTGVEDGMFPKEMQRAMGYAASFPRTGINGLQEFIGNPFAVEARSWSKNEKVAERFAYDSKKIKVTLEGSESTPHRGLDIQKMLTDAPFKEGEFIPIDEFGERVVLRIKRIEEQKVNNKTRLHVILERATDISDKERKAAISSLEGRIVEQRGSVAGKKSRKNKKQQKEEILAMTGVDGAIRDDILSLVDRLNRGERFDSYEKIDEVKHLWQSKEAIEIGRKMYPFYDEIINWGVQKSGKWPYKSGEVRMVGANAGGVMPNTTQTLFRNTGGPIFESQSKIVPSIGSTDTVPAMLTPGEFVINKQSTRDNLPLLHAINNGNVSGYAKGGQIPGMQYFGTPMSQRVVQQSQRGRVTENRLEGFNGARSRNDTTGGGLDPSVNTASLFELQGQDHVYAFANMDEIERGIQFPETFNDKRVKQLGLRPQDLLEEALRLNPNDAKIKSMLDNFKLNKINEDELLFLDRMAASTMIDDSGIFSAQNDGMATMLSHLLGDSDATQTIESKLNEFYRLVEISKKEESERISAQNKEPRTMHIGARAIRDKNPSGWDDLMENASFSDFAMVHSTGRDFERDGSGVSLYSTGTHNIQDGPYRNGARATIHFTANGEVSGGFLGSTVKNAKGEDVTSWGNENSLIVTSAKSIVEANGLPRNLKANDTWWSVNPGQALKLPNATVVRPITNEDTYREQLISRGLIKENERSPVFLDDKENNDILYLLKEKYTDEDRLEIVKIFDDGKKDRKFEDGLEFDRKKIEDFSSQPSLKQERDIWGDGSITETLVYPSKEEVEKRVKEIIEDRRRQHYSSRAKEAQREAQEMEGTESKILRKFALKEAIRRQGVDIEGPENITPMGVESPQFTELIRSVAKKHNTKSVQHFTTTEEVGESSYVLSNLHDSQNIGKKDLFDVETIRTLMARGLISVNRFGFGDIVPGVGNTDKVPAMLTPGEFVINKQATQSNLSLLHAINDGNTPQSMQGFNKGGQIPSIQYFADGGGPISLTNSLNAMRKQGAPANVIAEFEQMIIEQEAMRKAAKEAGWTQDQIDRGHKESLGGGKSKPFILDPKTGNRNWNPQSSIENQTTEKFRTRTESGKSIDTKMMKHFEKIAKSSALTAKLTGEEKKAMVKLQEDMKAGTTLNQDQINIQKKVFNEMLKNPQDLPKTSNRKSVSNETFLKAALSAYAAREDVRSQLEKGTYRGPTPDQILEANRAKSDKSQSETKSETKRSLPSTKENKQKERARVAAERASFRQEAANEVNKEKIRQQEESKNEQRYRKALSARLGGTPAEAIESDRKAAMITANKQTEDAIKRRIEQETERSITKKIKIQERYRRIDESIINRKTKEYEKAGMSPEEARAKAAQEIDQRRTAQSQVPVEEPAPERTPKKAGFFRSGVDAQGNKVASRMQRMAPGVHQASMGLGGGLMMASMAPMMMTDPETGKFMGMDPNMAMMGAMGAGTAVSMLPMLGGAAAPVAIALAGIAAAGFALYKFRDAADSAARSAAKVGSNLGGAADSLGNMSRITGIANPQKRLEAYKSMNTPEVQQQVDQLSQAFQQEGPAKDFIKSLKSEKGSDQGKIIADYIAGAIASKMLTQDEAMNFARAVGKEMNNPGLAAVGIGAANRQSAKGTLAVLDLAQQRESTVLSDPVIQRVLKAGVGEEVSASDSSQTIAAAMQIMKAYSEAQAMAEIEQRNGIITFQQFMDIVDQTKIATETWSNAIQKSNDITNDAGSTEQGTVDSLIAAGLNKDQVDLVSNYIKNKDTSNERGPRPGERFVDSVTKKERVIYSNIGVGALQAEAAKYTTTGEANFDLWKKENEEQGKNDANLFAEKVLQGEQNLYGSSEQSKEARLKTIQTTLNTYIAQNPENIQQGMDVVNEIISMPWGDAAKKFVEMGMGIDALTAAMNASSAAVLNLPEGLSSDANRFYQETASNLSGAYVDQYKAYISSAEDPEKAIRDFSKLGKGYEVYGRTTTPGGAGQPSGKPSPKIVTGRVGFMSEIGQQEARSRWLADRSTYTAKQINPDIIQGNLSYETAAQQTKTRKTGTGTYVGSVFDPYVELVVPDTEKSDAINDKINESTERGVSAQLIEYVFKMGTENVDKPVDVVLELNKISDSYSRLSKLPQDVLMTLGIDLTNGIDVMTYEDAGKGLEALSGIIQGMPEGAKAFAVELAFETNENGDLVAKSPKDFINDTNKFIKALDKIEKTKNPEVKKKLIFSLITETLNAKGEKVGDGDAERIYDEYVRKYGKQNIEKLDPDILTKSIIMRLDVSDLVEKANILSKAAGVMYANAAPGPAGAKAREEAEKRAGEAGAYLDQANQINLSANSLMDSGVGGTIGSKGGGGGGSNPLVDFKKSLLEQIRLYADLSMTLKKLFSSKMSFLKLLGSNKGVDDQLRAAGLGEAATQAVMSMGADAAKKWIKANITGGKNPRLKESGKRQEEALLAGAMKQRESEAVGAIENVKNQRTASRLIDSGKYGKATAETRASILSNPAEVEGFIIATKNYDEVQRKVLNWQKNNPKKSLPKVLGEEWDAAQKFAARYIDVQDKAFKTVNLQDQLIAADNAVSNQTNIVAGKALFKDKKIPKEISDAILGDSELLNAYMTAEAKIAKGAKAPKGAKGKKARAGAVEGRAEQARLEAGVVANLGDPELNKLQKELDTLNQAKVKSDRLYKEQTDPLLEQIDLINRQIDAIQKLNNADQNRIRNLTREKEMLERQVETLNRKNEVDQKSIEKLQREDEMRTRVADALNHELSLMSEQETKIREAYDKRVKALDEVAKINDYIINQQKSQLGLAQALSQGDVYAAAAAQQTMQTGSAQFAQEQMRSGLQTGMENQIEGLTTSGGLTRVQAEDQIRAIGEQTYQTSLLVRDLQDAIYGRNLEIAAIKIQQRDVDDRILVIQDDIYKRETEIIGLQTGKLTDLNDQLTAIQDQKNEVDKVAEANIMAAEVAIDNYNLGIDQVDIVNKLAFQWREVVKQIQNANLAMKNSLDGLGDAPTDPGTGASKEAKDAYKIAFADWKTKYDKIIADNKTARDNAYASGTAASAAVSAPVAAAATVATKPIAGGQGMMFATGGVVGQGGRDSVPSMLTPGEYVMRKASVQKYGMPMLSRMNMGAFDMPRYDTQQPNITSVQPTSNTSNINAPVYNTYSVNVSANTNASADDIANTVMTKIKRVDSMAVRSFRGY